MSDEALARAGAEGWQSYGIVLDDGLECSVCGERIEGDAWVRETESFTGPDARHARHGIPEPMRFIDAGDGCVDVLADSGDPQDYGLPLAAAVKQYGPHPVTTMEQEAER